MAASVGFIITRHVNSENTNKYWNHSVKLIQRLYPERKIVIIDDNSNQDFLKADYNYRNVEIIQSEFPGRGELLPYYYLIKRNLFDKALIIHDSVFIHKRINFQALKDVNVLPLWYFQPDTENLENTKRIIQSVANSHLLYDKLKNDTSIFMPSNNWFGCFGVQSYINRNFLLHIERKYNITNMIQSVLSRKDRCCLERIMGCIFYTEYPKILKIKSLFGDISRHHKWSSYTFEQYINHLKKGTVPHLATKVWTGR